MADKKMISEIFAVIKDDKKKEEKEVSFKKIVGSKEKDDKEKK